MASMADESDNVASEVGDGSSGVRLFSGIKLWFSQAVPQRDWLIRNAQLNGAEVVPLDKQADVLLVDHSRKNQAPNTTSYRFVVLSIQNGKLEDLKDHAVNVSTRVARAVGSATIAPKGGRTPFTEADDQYLWDVVKPFMDGGGKWQGNKIYEQIEANNPRHTYQSWRDRWIKKVQFQNRQVVQPRHPDSLPHGEQGLLTVEGSVPGARITQSEPVIVQAQTELPPQRPPSPNKRSRDEMEGRPTSIQPLAEVSIPREPPGTPLEHALGIQSESPVMTPISQRALDEQVAPPRRYKTAVKLPLPFPYGFGDDEAKALYRATKHLLETLEADPTTWYNGWRALAKSNSYPAHTPQQWRDFWQSIILPAYCERRQLNVEDVIDPQCLEREIEDEDETMGLAEEGSQEEALAAGDREDEDDEIEIVQVSATTERQNDVEEAARMRPTPPRPEARDSPASEARSSPAAIACTRCFTTETRKWRLDRDRNLLCNECGHFLKSSGMLRTSAAWTEVDDEETKDAEVEQIAAIDGLGTRQQLSLSASSRRFTIQIPKPGQVNAAVQTSPIEPPSPIEELQHKSTVLQPASPVASRTPGPNEARKRSKGSQSTSQETIKTNSQEKDAGMAGQTNNDHRREHAVTPPKEERTLEVTSTVSRKRRRLQDEPNTLEIPNTPEHKQSSSGTFGIALGQRSLNPASPQPSRPLADTPADPDSPLFVRRDATDEEREDADEVHSRHGSSPMMINLLDDDDPIPGQALRGHQIIEDAESEPDTASQYGFETAPETGLTRDWETAPEEVLTEKVQTDPRLETQKRFDIADSPRENDLEDEFAIPEPEGGWEELERTYVDRDVSQQDAESDKLPDLNDIIAHPERYLAATPPRRDKGKEKSIDDAVAIPDSVARSSVGPDDEEPIEDMVTWLAHIRQRHPQSTLPRTADLDKICMAVAKATSLDFLLATDIVGQILGFHAMLLSPSRIHVDGRIRAVVEGGGVPIPMNLRGCWTDEDDAMAFSQDPEDWERLAAKHGEEEVNGRFDFLEIWNRV